MSWIAKLLGKQDDADVGYSAEEKKIFASSFQIGWTVVAFGAAGLAAVALWADGARAAANVHFTAFFGADLLVAAAAASAGALFGFLFGIPRSGRNSNVAGRLRGGTQCPHGGQYQSRTSFGLAHDASHRRDACADQRHRRLGRRPRKGLAPRGYCGE